MCEFWHPYSHESYVGHPNFKPVKSCVSAARLYGKKRVAAEAFTSIDMTWMETPNALREQAVRHLAKGVTHFVFHTYTHNPHTDGRKPGSSFGSFIGTPFLKTQTWWDYMPVFTDWLTDCQRFLERGHAVVDVLRYLGDDYAHRPDECEPFPAGYTGDYLNQDALLTRLDVQDGVFALPDGMRYARIWIPDGTYLAPKTRARLAELAKKGGTIVTGDCTAAVRGLPPQVETAGRSPLAMRDETDLLWLHRRDQEADLYFLAALSNGFRGCVTLATAKGPKTLTLEFEPFESACVTIDAKGVSGLPPARVTAAVTDLSQDWTLSFPAGWGAPASLPLARLCAWKDLPDVSAEGRAFSGTACYTRTWTCPDVPTGRVELDLGDVRDLARVYVNGREAAVLWGRPFRCEIGALLKKGVNELRVEVTSSWFNRLAYDFNQPPAARKTWTIWNIPSRTPPCLKPHAPLQPSGLLGPVLLRSERALTVTPQTVQQVSTSPAGGTVYDFGKDAFGWLEMDSAQGGAYELVIGELTNAVGSVTNVYRGSTIRAVRVKGDARPGRFRIPLEPDFRNTHGPAESPAVLLDPSFGVVMPFRYVQAVTLPSDARLVRHVLHWPLDWAASSFESDSPVLNRVWEFCKYSIWATTFAGVYVDGDRERIPYEADAYINQLGHYAVDADYTLARRTHEYLLRFPTWPTEWKQHSIKMAWADWMWSGDRACVRRTYETLVKEKLHAGFTPRADGLLVTSGAAKIGPRDIVDWPISERDGFDFKPVNAVVNAFYFRNLLEMADLAVAAGRPAEADGFRTEAARVCAAYARVFFDPARGVYVDGEGSPHASLHANAAALAFGLVPPQRQADVVRFLDGKGMACSVYFAQYLLDAYCRAGRTDLALKYITASGERSWQGMMDFGSTITMEAWNMKAKPNQDLNHAWATAPLNIISRFVLGVTPLEPGFRRIAVSPSFAGLKRVSARVPTMAGTVSIDWRDGVLRLDVPAATRLTWGGKVQDLAPGPHTFF
jgi:hypothetical protein